MVLEALENKMEPGTQIIKINADWIDIKNKCRTTVNKDPSNKEATASFKQKLLISEHSPIRLLEIEWIWKGIKSWISVHFARHWLGWDKWISTQRDDRTGINRDDSPQNTPVNYEGKGNAQAFINVSRYRLCVGSAHPETRKYMENLKGKIEESEPELALVMVPNCIYRSGCPEFSCCGHIDRFRDWTAKNGREVDLLSILDRYIAYKTWRKEGGI